MLTNMKVFAHNDSVPLAHALRFLLTLIAETGLNAHSLCAH